MHLLSQQLQELMRASKSYEAKGSAEAATVVLPVRFEFKDRVFFQRRVWCLQTVQAHPSVVFAFLASVE
ncbi:hypothetical protein TCSYLVIO_010608 [Trypanosoma cruzi]|nr:hypothetical protein TCSYLVIO_010608 [Trypanosoma cruzi]